MTTGQGVEGECGQHVVAVISRDKGRTWSAPANSTFANGRPIKHPRAYAPAWKLSNGNYPLWFHNHGGESVHTDEWGKGSYYQSRNPVWVSGGVERNGRIEWRQAENKQLAARGLALTLVGEQTKAKASFVMP